MWISLLAILMLLLLDALLVNSLTEDSVNIWVHDSFQGLMLQWVAINADLVVQDFIITSSWWSGTNCRGCGMKVVYAIILLHCNYAFLALLPYILGHHQCLNRELLILLLERSKYHGSAVIISDIPSVVHSMSRLHLRSASTVRYLTILVFLTHCSIGPTFQEL